MDSELGGKFWMDPYPSLSLCYFTYLCYILHFGPPRTIYLHSTICTNIKYSLRSMKCRGFSSFLVKFELNPRHLL
jgi:hypothetical protein